MAQQTVFPLDSLTTRPAIPRSAVTIPPGKPSGPNARLQAAIYGNILYPRTALTSGTSGKVVVFGVIDTLGAFLADSAVLYDERATLVLGTEANGIVKGSFRLGKVDSLMCQDGRLLVQVYPRKWSKAQEDLVQEAVRVANNLPAFKAGTRDGQKVNVGYSFPVVFRNLGMLNGPGKKRKRKNKRKS